MKEFVCIAHIRKNATGEIRTDRTVGFGEEVPSDFIWRDGNFSCDCNRELFFERAGGVEINNEKCSEGRFSVNLENDEGKIYYREFTA